MKNALALLAFAATGCSIVSGSMDFTNGTRCLNEGNYEEARVYLEKATEKLPELSRNHNNLAYAYLQLGDWDRAGYHYRQMMLCDYITPDQEFNFNNLYVKKLKSLGYDKPGLTEAEVIANLGEPDWIEVDGDSTSFQYGLYLIEFKNHVVVRSVRI